MSSCIVSKCGHLSKKTGEVCGKPCETNLKKPRCEKHGGADLKIIETKQENTEVNPYKPASKEWLEWNKKMKKKSKKDKEEIIEVNPFTQVSEITEECMLSLKSYKPSLELSPLCLNNGKYLLKGTPVYYNNGTTYYVCDSFKIELLSIRNYKGWGTTELEVVKEENDIDSKGQKFPINQFIIENKNLYNKEPESSTFIFRKYMKEINDKNFLVYIIDESTKIDEKEKLIECAGGFEPIKYSEVYHRLDVRAEEKWSLTITLENLPEEELHKLIQKKLTMRETYGDDYMYREFLYKKYGVKKNGGPEYKSRDEEFGEKFLDSLN
jgi:hypothetical protein